MPGAPGECYVRRMREVAPTTPILMFTGQAVSANVSALVDSVIIKPVMGPELVQAIETLVERFAPSRIA
jgi:DNA-binding response OmpR family regulator